jgi:hypothetical protein
MLAQSDLVFSNDPCRQIATELAIGESEFIDFPVQAFA